MQTAVAHLTEPTLRNLTAEELVRMVDRSDPEVKALAEKLEEFMDLNRELTDELETVREDLA